MTSQKNEIVLRYNSSWELEIVEAPADTFFSFSSLAQMPPTIIRFNGLCIEICANTEFVEYEITHVTSAGIWARRLGAWPTTS